MAKRHVIKISAVELREGYRNAFNVLRLIYGERL